MQVSIDALSKITAPLCKLLAKKVDFMFDQACKDAHDELKKRVTSTPIIQPQNWDEPFEIICDAIDYLVGVVLGQRIEKNFACYRLCFPYVGQSAMQLPYNWKKKLFAVVFALKKFKSYLLYTKFVVFTDHA